MRKFLLIIGLCLILASALMALTVAKIEPAQRNIIYLHIPPAVCSLTCFTVLFICSILYLRTKLPAADRIAAASAEVGLVMALLMNATGMLFARLEWGIWWTPSPRLIASAILFFLLVAYVILRAALPSDNRSKRISAVFGIIAYINVPFVAISARFIRDIHRPSFSFESPSQTIALILAFLGTLFLTLALISFRTQKLKND